MPLLLGCVADDFTGATDLASMLVKNGMSCVQVIGVPPAAERHGEAPSLPEADAVVVALKSRTAPVAQAVAESLAAAEALLAGGARQLFFKYCSTFDSTDEGNIGPVADALLKRLGAGFAIACPAFPANGRSIYQGHLFVGARLLSESGMENHPLTPMKDPDLVRVLSRQTDGGVGLVPFAVVEQGAAAIRREFTRLAEAGRRHAIVDAVSDAHLHAIGEACAGHALVTGGSGVAMGLPENFRRAGLLPPRSDAATLPRAEGLCAVVAGSCSRATLGQIGFARDHLPVLELDALAMPDAGALAAQALDWVEGRLDASRPVVVAASAPPEKVAALQAKLGREAAGVLVEDALAAVAEGLVARGVRRLVVAGGETSGAVVQRLGVTSLRIGAEIDPGVPWTFAPLPPAAGVPQAGIHLALKSGNFGARDFFLKAFQHV
ncbi:3-oxo-tetronate kinase [Falsiroseomonas oryzae]|uniref:3-oxo-tetronate kinase n=1 Tax=Falsiroseomonas oryzae TaxID=2766473 RepID=UPI0022EA151A|nr:3-oxo-tetronate kinase [Roseomonas sp. MO-31]